MTTRRDLFQIQVPYGCMDKCTIPLEQCVLYQSLLPGRQKRDFLSNFPFRPNLHQTVEAEGRGGDEDANMLKSWSSTPQSKKGRKRSWVSKAFSRQAEDVCTSNVQKKATPPFCPGEAHRNCPTWIQRSGFRKWKGCGANSFCGNLLQCWTRTWQFLPPCISEWPCALPTSSS